MHVKDYIYVRQQALSEADCDAILLNTHNYRENTWAGADGTELVKDNDPSIAEYDESTLLPSGMYLNDIIISTAKMYANSYKENLMTLRDVSNGTIHSFVEGDKFDKHIDNIFALFDGEKKGKPVLSVILSLSSDYEGGDFVFTFPGSEEEVTYRLNKGDVIYFPSCFIYKHQVMPITKGKRITLVKWMW